jgi:hypothetical protein
MDDDSIRWHAEVGQQEEQEMDSIDKLSAAMAKAFPAIEGAVKGKVNPAFRSKYADLSAVIDAIKPHLVEHGLWFVQRTHPVDGGVGVETVILHASGQSMSCGVLRLPAAKQDAQGYGSALTYARRYSLMAAFGVPAEDDDGNAATGRQQAREASPQLPVPPERYAAIAMAAGAAVAKFEAGNEWGAYEEVLGIEDEPEKLLLWSMLKPHSKLRTYLKEAAAAERAKATAGAS